MKRKRIVDKGLIALIRTFPCMACGIRPVDAHHVQSRGAGGDDIPENVIALCRHHHRMWHSGGAKRMANAYPGVKRWLQLAGWKHDGRRWRRGEAS